MTQRRRIGDTEKRGGKTNVIGTEGRGRRKKKRSQGGKTQEENEDGRREKKQPAKEN